MASDEEADMSTDIVVLKVRKREGKRRISIELLLPKWTRRRDTGKSQRVITVALAVAVVGLVTLLAMHLWPALGDLLLCLLKTAF
jgi:hypothetical protein